MIAPQATLLWIAVVACASLDANTIRRVFRRHRDQIRHCYEVELRKDHNLRGRLVLRLTIDGDGHASAAEIVESALANDDLHACIADAARRWHFPIVGNHSTYTISYPYVLEPAPPPAEGGNDARNLDGTTEQP
jgi:hypothetical protein